MSSYTYTQKLENFKLRPNQVPLLRLWQYFLNHEEPKISFLGTLEESFWVVVGGQTNYIELGCDNNNTNLKLTTS